jgi:hypothetical protein
MSQRGLPDNPRTARILLKDFVNGKLLYCHPPPGCDEAVFEAETKRSYLVDKDQKAEEEKKQGDIMPANFKRMVKVSPFTFEITNLFLVVILKQEKQKQR